MLCYEYSYFVELCRLQTINKIYHENEISNILFFWMSSILFSCKNDPKNSETMDVAPDPKDGVALSVNLFGDKLNEWPDPDSVVSMRQSVIETARTAYLGKLEEPKGYLVYGRAYLTNGNVENAIQIFGKGSAKFPKSLTFMFTQARQCSWEDN